MLCARLLPGVRPYKPAAAAGALWAAVALILAGCGRGGAEEASQVVRGDGYRFDAPREWNVERTGRSAAAAEGEVDRVEVTTFPLLKAYRPAMFGAASKELDRAAAKLARRLHGKLAWMTTVRAAGRDARSYRIDYNGKAQEITFVLHGRREFQLICRRAAGGDRSACRALLSSFALA